MMGLLSWMNAESDDAPYSVRRDGVVARATAISQGKPTTRVSAATPVGLISNVDEISGSTPFWLKISAWTNTPLSYQIDENGSDPSDEVNLMGITSLAGDISDSETTITVSDTSGFPTDEPPFRIRIDNEIVAVESINGMTWTVTRGVSGSTPQSHDEHTTVIAYTSRTAGEARLDSVSQCPPENCDLDSMQGKSAHEYVPLFANIAGKYRIIGFGRVTWSWDSVTSTLDITPLDSIVAPSGTTATQFVSGLSQGELSEILTLRSSVENLLLSPVRVRTIR